MIIWICTKTTKFEEISVKRIEKGSGIQKFTIDVS